VTLLVVRARRRAGPAHGACRSPHRAPDRATDAVGASLVEYLLLVAFIAIAVIASIGFFGGELETRFDDVGSTVSSTP